MTTLVITVPVLLGRTLPGIHVFLRQQQIVFCEQQWLQQVTSSVGQAVSAHQVSGYYGHLRIRLLLNTELEKTLRGHPDHVLPLCRIGDNQPLPDRCLSCSYLKPYDGRCLSSLDNLFDI